MAAGSDKPDDVTQVALADGGHQAAAGAKLHQDARGLHVVETPAGRLIELKVGPHDTLSNLGRELYRKYGHHEASPQELKAFANDAAHRNGLKTQYSRDHLHEGQPLTLSLPGVSIPAESTRHAAKPAAKPAAHEAAAHGAGKNSPAPETHPPTATAKVAAEKAAPAAPAKPVTSAEAKAIMKGGDSCTGDWSNMVAQWVTHNEVSQKKFLAFNPNDHGAGISVGLLQWNQKKGRLPELLKDWHAKDPGKFDRIFGGYSANLLKTEWVKGADFNGNATLNKGMHDALADPEFQQVQLNLRNAHIVKSCEVAQDNGFKSLRGRAVVADLFNQIGERGTVNALHRVPDGKPESARIEALKKVTGSRTNGTDRVASIEDNVKEIWRKLGSQ